MHEIAVTHKARAALVTRFRDMLINNIAPSDIDKLLKILTSNLDTTVVQQKIKKYLKKNLKTTSTSEKSTSNKLSDPIACLGSRFYVYVELHKSVDIYENEVSISEKLELISKRISSSLDTKHTAENMRYFLENVWLKRASFAHAINLISSSNTVQTDVVSTSGYPIITEIKSNSTKEELDI